MSNETFRTGVDSMTSFIPAEAIDAAAKVLVWEEYQGLYAYHPEGHPKRDDVDRYAQKHARAALEAAAPYMQAAPDSDSVLAILEAAGVDKANQFDALVAVQKLSSLAAPYILQAAKAEALEEAAEAIDADPYDDLDPFYVGWLKNRAEKIREGE